MMLMRRISLYPWWCFRTRIYSLSHFLFILIVDLWIVCYGIVGSKGCSFPTLIRDYIRIYQLNFVANMEPRISGSRAAVVMEQIGLNGDFQVDVFGFSGGLWCLWNSVALNIKVTGSSKYCVHLISVLTLHNRGLYLWYMQVRIRICTKLFGMNQRRFMVPYRDHGCQQVTSTLLAMLGKKMEVLHLILLKSSLL